MFETSKNTLNCNIMHSRVLSRKYFLWPLLIFLLLTPRGRAGLRLALHTLRAFLLELTSFPLQINENYWSSTYIKMTFLTWILLHYAETTGFLGVWFITVRSWKSIFPPPLPCLTDTCPSVCAVKPLAPHVSHYSLQYSDYLSIKFLLDRLNLKSYVDVVWCFNTNSTKIIILYICRSFYQTLFVFDWRNIWW